MSFNEGDIVRVKGTMISECVGDVIVYNGATGMYTVHVPGDMCNDPQWVQCMDYEMTLIEANEET